MTTAKEMRWTSLRAPGQLKRLACWAAAPLSRQSARGACSRARAWAPTASAEGGAERKHAGGVAQRGSDGNRKHAGGGGGDGPCVAWRRQICLRRARPSSSRPHLIRSRSCPTGPCRG
uniref:Uncharacterized protein n=1 Tax=Arundo donax TaxID=35708 RepID=A0A0A8ZV28_ARUDO